MTTEVLDPREARGGAGRDGGPGAPGQLRPSATAEINCAQRVAEMHRPPDARLFEDPYARCFLQARRYRALVAWGPLARLALRAFDRRYPGLHVEIMLRNRVYERELARALATGVDQVVLLGAGYDSTSLRLDLGPATLYELDAAPTQRAKLRALERLGKAATGGVRYVECDLEASGPRERLLAAGLDPGRRTFAASFGVLFYLSEAAVRRTLAEMAAVMAPGSRLVFDYLDESVVDGTTPYPGARRAEAAVRRRGEPYVFGLGPESAVELADSAGFAAYDHLRAPDLCERYGPPAGTWCSPDDYLGVLATERRP
ncbi:MAG TPA: SAM-dependent methyltransferase [Thermoleophilaceae bacterium]|jgi:methyltransferase (TIGR00027 family)